MPRITSNIPFKMFNAAYAVEILRIGRVTSAETIIMNHCSILISRMIDKEGNVNTISNTLSKTFVRHIQTFSKLYAKSPEFVESICPNNSYI